MTKSNF